MRDHTPTSSTLEVTLLGGFEVSLDGVPLTQFYSDKVRALLAFMTLQGDHPVRREVVANLLWPRYRPQSQRVNLRRAIYELRRDVAPFPLLETTHQTLALSQEARDGGLKTDIQALDEKIDALGEGLEALGYARAQGRLRSLIREGQAPICLGLSVLDDGPGGFGEWSDEITEGLNTRLRSLSRRVGELGALAPQGSLPAEITPLIGRRRELEILDGRLLPRSHRLIAITGPGGMGKSRLAQAAAQRVRGTFSDGAWWIDAEYAWRRGHQDAEGCRCWLSGILLKALGAPTAPTEDPFQALQESLRGRDLLMILDGLDPFIDGPCQRPTCDLLFNLLTENPGLVLITTSRRSLPLAAAAHVPLQGLTHRDAGTGGIQALLAGSAAARLFVERSLSVLGGEGLEDADAPPLARLCESLEGQPLAIELAAALHGGRTLTELADSIALDPLSLSAPLLDLPESHRSIGALLGGTWAGLPLPMRRALGALTQLEGSFTAGEAEVALGEIALPEGGVEALLGALQSRSLITRIDADHWRMHTLIHHLVVHHLAQGALRPPPRFKAADLHAPVRTEGEPKGEAWAKPSIREVREVAPPSWEGQSQVLMS